MVLLPQERSDFRIIFEPDQPSSVRTARSTVQLSDCFVPNLIGKSKQNSAYPTHQTRTLPEHVLRPEVLRGREVPLGEAAVPSHRGLAAFAAGDSSDQLLLLLLLPVPGGGGGGGARLHRSATHNRRQTISLK